MRLTELRRRIDIAADKFEFKYRAQGNSCIIDNIQNLKIAVNELIKIGLLEKKGFWEEVLFSDYVSIQKGPAEFNLILQEAGTLTKSISMLKHWATQNIPLDEEPDYVNIKLPKIKDFDQLSKVSDQLRLAFSQVVCEYEGGQLEIVRFEQGSLWVVVEVGTAAMLVAGLVWSGAVISKKILECRHSYEVYRNASARNDLLKELQKLAEVQVNNMIELEAKALQDEHFGKENAEQLERIKNSIRNISDLILKGTEIQPALAAPENVQNLFPDFTKLPLIESKVKKLPQHN